MGRYDQQNDNTEADTFRATLIVAAMSCGFSGDLRSNFETLNFPIDDSTYNELMNAVSPLSDFDDNNSVNLDDLRFMADYWLNTGPGIGADLNNDKTVNLLDFAEFAFVWQGN